MNDFISDIKLDMVEILVADGIGIANGSLFFSILLFSAMLAIVVFLTKIMSG